MRPLKRLSLPPISSLKWSSAKSPDTPAKFTMSASVIVRPVLMYTFPISTSSKWRTQASVMSQMVFQLAKGHNRLFRAAERRSAGSLAVPDNSARPVLAELLLAHSEGGCLGEVAGELDIARQH